MVFLWNRIVRRTAFRFPLSSPALPLYSVELDWNRSRFGAAKDAPMGCFLLLPIVVVASLMPNAASAKGGTLHLLAPHAAASAVTQGVSASDLLAGCGRGRFRDPITQKCR